MSFLINSFFVNPNTQLTYITTLNVTASAGVSTFTGANIGTAAADRIVLLVLGSSRTAGANTGLTSVTIAGNACTLLGSTNTGVTESAGIAWLLVPTGATANIVVTWVAAVQGTNLSIYTLTGLVSPIAYASRQAVSGSTASISLPIPATNGAIFAGVDAEAGTASAFTWGGGLTVDSDAAGFYSAGNERFSSASLLCAGQSSPLTITANNTNTERALFGGVIASLVSETLPSVVQCSSTCGTGIVATTMGATPTTGNLLLALCGHNSNSGAVNTGAGWIELENTDGVTHDGTIIAYKYVSGDTTTVTPLSSNSSGGSVTVFEIANFGDLDPSRFAWEYGQFTVRDVTANTTYSHDEITTTTKNLVVGIVSNNNGTTQPTSITGITATDAAVTGTSRAVTAWHINATAAGTATVLTTFPSSQTMIYISVTVRPLQR